MADTSYTVTGTLYKKNPIQVVSEKFKKIDFIVKTVGEYPQFLQIQVGNDKTAMLDNVNGGDEVTVQVNVKGRLWTDPNGVEKCFNTLEAWKIERGAVSQPAPGPSAPPINAADDLPFWH